MKSECITFQLQIKLHKQFLHVRNFEKKNPYLTPTIYLITLFYESVYTVHKKSQAIGPSKKKELQFSSDWYLSLRTLTIQS